MALTLVDKGYFVHRRAQGGEIEAEGERGPQAYWKYVEGPCFP